MVHGGIQFGFNSTSTISITASTTTNTTWWGSDGQYSNSCPARTDSTARSDDEIEYIAKVLASRAAMAVFLAAHASELRRPVPPPQPSRLGLAAKDRRWRSRWLGRRPHARQRDFRCATA